MFVPSTPILIVDDMPSMRKMVMMVFKQAGFINLSEAKDGADAWHKVVDSRPRIGLIVSDWMMPVSTGIDFLRRVRGSDEFKKTPFVMLTAEALPETIQEAMIVGVDQYMIKPFNKDILLEKLALVEKKYAVAA